MKNETFVEMVNSVNEAAAIYRGEQQPSRSFHIDPLDIKKIRDGNKMTKKKFAALLGISTSTLQNWEQG